MPDLILVPKVDETQEFLEIAHDFSNPLELVREAISNAFDAKAERISISFDVVTEQGEKVLVITVTDNGTGMDQVGLQSFFDLGNSLRRGDPDTIGEKGHGTKVYFNSSSIAVFTSKGGKTFEAIMLDPFKKLFNREIPIVKANERDSKPDDQPGTRIVIRGYNNNRRELFTHERLKDYIKWFSKFGSVELACGVNTHEKVVLHLKGLDQAKPDEIAFGHYFPRDSKSINDLFEEHLVKAPDFYSKVLVKKGQLKNFPEITYDAVFGIEGNRVKQTYNKMLRRSGYTAPQGSYTVQERYGLWLCKDYIPIQRKNEWITYRGSEYTRFHAFFNCQEFRLTANRGSVDNTPSEIMADVKEAVLGIYNEIIEGDAWREIEWLESEAEGYRTTERERKDFQWRIKKANSANVVAYKNAILVEPQRESGVFAILVQLNLLEPTLFPFEVVDYDTHSGIDVIAKGDKTTPIQNARLFYVEVKQLLTKEFNHSFENLHSIVCWDTEIKHDDILVDVNNEQRKMQIIAPTSNEDYTRYYLDHPKKAHKIQVFVLKDYLKERLNLDFRPRGATAT